MNANRSNLFNEKKLNRQVRPYRFPLTDTFYYLGSQLLIMKYGPYFQDAMFKKEATSRRNLMPKDEVSPIKSIPEIVSRPTPKACPEHEKVILLSFILFLSA